MCYFFLKSGVLQFGYEIVDFFGINIKIIYFIGESVWNFGDTTLILTYIDDGYATLKLKRCL